jgi:hypothetical protein
MVNPGQSDPYSLGETAHFLHIERPLFVAGFVHFLPQAATYLDTKRSWLITVLYGFRLECCWIHSRLSDRQSAYGCGGKSATMAIVATDWMMNGFWMRGRAGV